MTVGLSGQFNYAEVPRKNYPDIGRVSIQDKFTLSGLDLSVAKPLAIGLDQIFNKQAIDERMNYTAIEKNMANLRSSLDPLITTRISGAASGAGSNITFQGQDSTAGTIVFTPAGAATFSSTITVVAGGITITAGGLIVTAGGAAITGNSQVTGTLGVSGLLSASSGITTTGLGAAAINTASITNLTPGTLSLQSGNVTISTVGTISAAGSVLIGADCHVDSGTLYFLGAYFAGKPLYLGGVDTYAPGFRAVFAGN